MRQISISYCATLALVLFSSPATAFETISLTGNAAQSLPACSDAGVLGTIRSRHAAATPEARDGIEIRDIHDAGPGRLEAFGPSAIATRHCAAKARLADGRTGRLYYMLSAGRGFAGIGWNVDFCVAGHDPWYVYGQECRSLK
ncbi:hypothetical protein [Methylobrevis pamukkalensis]|uniref:Uncharacterized protein n=1 Tax=Methylobrevis pamukkalensis TaxID=1439726 RepID=A0A1E3H555_9HYPH|nr:hypothetical protein [Methylobrevis pamukkalensis]ODN71467.1 hypothetical protein A6302_01156 [Methylobrevis pamukkalensis]